jgi:hypothetical protein
LAVASTWVAVRRTSAASVHAVTSVPKPRALTTSTVVALTSLVARCIAPSTPVPLVTYAWALFALPAPARMSASRRL